MISCLKSLNILGNLKESLIVMKLDQNNLKMNVIDLIKQNTAVQAAQMIKCSTLF